MEQQKRMIHDKINVLRIVVCAVIRLHEYMILWNNLHASEYDETVWTSALINFWVIGPETWKLWPVKIWEI